MYRSSGKETDEARQARIVTSDRAMDAAMKFISYYCKWNKPLPTVSEPGKVDDDDIVLVDYMRQEYWREIKADAAEAAFAAFVRVIGFPCAEAWIARLKEEAKKR
jgi:hypothetical protein